MKISELEDRVREIEIQMRGVRPEVRDTLRPRVRDLIRSLNARHFEVPRELARINRQLEDEAAEDMFDNMPV